jgi:hypothetical protein
LLQQCHRSTLHLAKFRCDDNLPNNGKKPGQMRWESVLADSAADERDESVSS